jgi:hypothetical protein
LAQVRDQIPESSRKLSFTPDPALRPNRLNLPPQASSLLREPDLSRFAGKSALMVPTESQQFLREPNANRFSDTPGIKIPEAPKQFLDRP